MPKQATMDRSEPLSDREYYGDLEFTQRTLRDQEQVPVYVPQPHGSQPQYTKYLPVVINGVYYYIRYGKYTMVPRHVYERLVAGVANWVDGQPIPFVQPLHEDDVRLLPKSEAQEMLYKNIAPEITAYHATGQLPSRRDE